jgi:hypothetical protein
MTEKYSAGLEMTVFLPLGVIASKLQRIEADLRLLNIRLSGFAVESHGDGSVKLVAAQVEQINELLESIKRLVSNLEFDEPRTSSDYRGSGKPRLELDD